MKQNGFVLVSRVYDMERLSLPFFYRLGAKVGPLAEMQLEPDKRFEIFVASVGIADSLQLLLGTFPTLNVCRACGKELMDAINKASTWFHGKKVEEWETKDYQADAIFKEVINKAKTFETVLSAELENLATYHVTQKGIYSTPELVERAELALPESVREKLDTQILNEIRESGRCLAFDNATASGFHIMRATEAVMHQYYLAVCEPEDTKKLVSWGAYIKALRDSTDPTILETVAVLQQIKDNDRNLIMHPERILSPDDAFTLFEVAKGAMMSMAGKLKDKKETHNVSAKPKTQKV